MSLNPHIYSIDEILRLFEPSTELEKALFDYLKFSIKVENKHMNQLLELEKQTSAELRLEVYQLVTDVEFLEKEIKAKESTVDDWRKYVNSVNNEYRMIQHDNNDLRKALGYRERKSIINIWENI